MQFGEAVEFSGTCIEEGRCEFNKLLRAIDEQLGREESWTDVGRHGQ